MKHICSLLVFVFLICGCKNDGATKTAKNTVAANAVTHAKGLEIYRHDGYSIVKVTAPWPDAKDSFTYILHKKGVAVPDSLKSYVNVQVPIKSIVVTSTTHIPSLDMLGVENTLVAFPNTEYISSEKIRALIDSGKVQEVGSNESMNIEKMIDLAPSAVVGHSISSDNKTLDNLQQSGLKVLYNGDWTEQTPLGKAEWIKLFGALYGLEDKADALFANIEKEYNAAVKLAKNTTVQPTVLCGAMYQDRWYMPQGDSWGAYFLKDAHSRYLWSDATGAGSLNLSFEAVLDKAENADFWIGPSQFTSLKEMTNSNPHYGRFKAFKDKQVYSYSNKKGATGGLIYYELAPNRPDLVLKDLIKILHPELLKDYELHFFEKLK